MNLGITLLLCLALVVLGCKKEIKPDPEENVQSYITFIANGKKYRIQNGATNQYIQYRINYDSNSARGYRLSIGGADSVAVVPSFSVFVRSENKVVPGKYINSFTLPVKFESGMGAILPQYNDAAEYIGYWSSFDATLEVSELDSSRIKGSFYGSIATNSVNFPSKTIQISEGTFFVNRLPGYSQLSQF